MVGPEIIPAKWASSVIADVERCLAEWNTKNATTLRVAWGAATAEEQVRLMAQISGLTGQDLAQQPDVAAKLSRACLALRNSMLDAAKVSELTGRRKRRGVLDSGGLNLSFVCRR